jgi:hypothetical protein
MTQLESTITVSQLLRTLERADAQCITIFRDGTGHIVMARHSAPAFHSLPELSRFVDEVTSRPPVAVPSGLSSTQTANAS